MGAALLRAPPPRQCALPLLLVAVLAAALPLAHCYRINIGGRAAAQLDEFVKTLPPHGDPMGAMSDPLRSAWGTDLKLTATQTLHALQPPRPRITVEVKLVGFDGSGNEGLVIEPYELQGQLSTLHNELETVALTPGPKHMSVRPTIDFRVHPVEHRVQQTVLATIADLVEHAPPSTTFTDLPLALIEPNRVAHELEDDFVAAHGGQAAPVYTLYLLNPRAAAPYAYTYDKDHRACPGGMYLSRQFRYAFLDLTANVTFLGPGPGGKGQVLSHSIPSPRHYRPEAARRAVPPDLAAVVWSAVQHLVWPPLHHGDVAYHAGVAVHIIYMHQDLMGAASHVDVKAMEIELQSSVDGMQTVMVYEHWQPFGNCAQCVAGYASALRSRTARPHGDEVAVAEFLDGGELGAWVRDWREAVLQGLGIKADEGWHILPVFVFDVDETEPVLIDGWRQAIPLASGDVVAVRSGRSTVATFFGCHSKQVHLDPTEVERPILAAVLQAGWGVSDPALFWSPATGRGWSYLWSLGHNPFGPLVTSTSLAFNARDAMARNMAVAALNASLAHAEALVEGFARVAGPDTRVTSHLAPEDVVPYNQRIALLLFKTHEAVEALGRLDFHTALGYAVSTAHDAAALHAVVRRAGASLSTELECIGQSQRDRWYALPGGAAAVCLALLAWRALRGGSGDGGGGGRRRATKMHY